MAEYDPFESSRWPPWLQDIAVRVDELVSQPEVMQRFQNMVHEWAEEHGKKDPQPPIDERGHIRYNPVELLPTRATSCPEKFATLAAIRDCICEGGQPINPWHIDADTELDSANLPTARAL